MGVSLRFAPGQALRSSVLSHYIVLLCKTTPAALLQSFTQFKKEGAVKKSRHFLRKSLKIAIFRGNYENATF